MTSAHHLLLALLIPVALVACRSDPARDADHASPAMAMHGPSDAFFHNLSTLCGKAFAGRVDVDRPTPAGSSPFAGRRLVMHVRECTDDTLRIPFVVGDDRSRTWVITRTPEGLRLKHDHRKFDGSDDPVTMYGGDSTDEGTATRQVFPADEESRALFAREDREVSITNVWAMEIEPGQRFVYELSRPGRLFRIEFDLTETVDPPPPPWGWREPE